LDIIPKNVKIILEFDPNLSYCQPQERNKNCLTMRGYFERGGQGRRGEGENGRKGEWERG